MVSSSLALLYFLLGFHVGRQGSGPNRGRSPVEWGDFPSVRLSVCLLICLPHSLGYPARPEVQPARPEAQPARPEAKPASDASGFRLAGPRTWLVAWLAALLPPMKNKKNSRAGQGNR